MFWECPANQNIRDPAVLSTNHLIERATTEPQYLAFWTRGILPWSWIEGYGRYRNEPEVIIATGDPDVWDQGGTFYLDASGGVDTRNPGPGRIGWSVNTLRATIEGQLVPAATVSGDKGDPQHIQRVRRG